MISAIQIEAPKPGIRENVTTWSQFAKSFTTATDEYFYRHINRRIKNQLFKLLKNSSAATGAMLSEE